MTQLLAGQAGTTQPRQTARAAIAAAGCAVAELHDLAEMRDAAQLFTRVWGRARGNALVPVEVMRALVHAGNYASGAYVDDRMVGASLAFLGQRNGEVEVHSHVTALVDGTRSRGVGFALKQHQRAWALDRGIEHITWTFDPLVRRNAYFNLCKLGADATEYYRDFYGVMDDQINARDETDRLLVVWSLTSPKATMAAAGSVLVSADADPFADAAVLLDEDPSGAPVERTASGPRLLCRVPDDIVALRQRAPRVAQAWRRALRDTLGAAMQEGYHVTAMTRSGWYILDAST
ncbi:MAG: GNAT family N-acetyltransferase [Actinobacteria bacterium]|nr:GNAT family N-acetyltransferase [Actinomycetota bacterium]